MASQPRGTKQAAPPTLAHSPAFEFLGLEPKHQAYQATHVGERWSARTCSGNLSGRYSRVCLKRPVMNWAYPSSKELQGESSAIARRDRRDTVQSRQHGTA